MRVQSSQIERPAAVVCVCGAKFAKVQCGQAHCAGVAPGMTRATATSEEGGGAAARAARRRRRLALLLGRRPLLLLVGQGLALVPLGVELLGLSRA